MKKFLMFLASALTVFAVAACQGEKNDPDDNDKNGDGRTDGNKNLPALTISAANIDVTGIDKDYLVIVDQAAKTIKITLDYSDKENAKALTVNFLNLPEGVTAEYQKTFNYADGAEQTVAFKYGTETLAEFKMSVALGDPDPKFVTLTVNEIDALGGEVHMASAASLSHLPVEFTVDPEETEVLVNGEAIETGAELDFTDKVNGVTFTLKLGDITKTHKVIVITSGLRKATRVWGHYVQPETVEDDWYQTVIERGIEGFWQRSLGMDDKYIYLAQHGGAANGAFVIDIKDGSLVGNLLTTGIEGGTHTVSCIRTIPDGNGYRILQTNLAIGGVLKVYSWKDKDSAPENVLAYENVDGLRLGDKMGVFGTWQDGALVFVPHQGEPRNVYIFPIKDGKVSATPTKSSLSGFGGTYSEIYKYSDTEILAVAAGLRPTVYNVSGTTLTKTLDANSEIFSSTDEGFNFFTFNDQKYMAFTRLTGDLVDASLRIMALNGDTLKEAIEAIDGTSVFTYGLGDPGKFPIAGYKSGNSLADCTVRVIDGETYIAALSEGAGISLFKLEK